MPKQCVVYTRVDEKMKARLEKEAERRGEGESVLVREAITQYLERRAGNPEISSADSDRRRVDAAALAALQKAAELLKHSAGEAAGPNAETSSPKPARSPRRDPKQS